MTKNLLLGIAAVCGSTFQAVACTGISLTSRDGSYVQARTIEWARGVLQSEYVIIPRGQQLTSFTPYFAVNVSPLTPVGVNDVSC